MTNPFETIEARLSNIENLLLNLKHPAPVPIAEPDEIDIHEVSRLTGDKISKIYKDTMNNDIPHSKRGKKLVFSRREVKQWLQDRTIRKTGVSYSIKSHLSNVSR